MNFNYNGKSYPQDSLIIGPDSRALRYGDGIFETVKYKNGQLILIEEHLARLWKGMQLLQFHIPKLFTPERIEREIIDLIKKNKLTSARIRLTVIRGDGGLYDAKNNANWIIQSWPLAEENGLLNSNGLQLCIYREAQKMTDAFCNIKHNNYLPYFMGAMFAKKQQCNDAVILNQHLRICDSTIANIYMIKDEIIYTPSLTEGCVAGVMRNFFLQQLPSLGFNIKEASLTLEELLEADEIFLSNSLFNIRWVGAVENKILPGALTKKIYESLLQTNGPIIC